MQALPIPFPTTLLSMVQCSIEIINAKASTFQLESLSHTCSKEPVLLHSTAVNSEAKCHVKYFFI